jgi:signal transduction histidine kinase
MSENETMQDKQLQSREHVTVSETPALLFLLIVTSIFVAETGLMVVLPLFPNLSLWMRALTDSALLIAIVFPTLYCFTYRPLRLHISELFRVQSQLRQQIGERQQAEAALSRAENRLQHLSSHLLKLQEEERRRVSRELHEDLAQCLVALKISLKSVEECLAANQVAVREECRQGMALIDSVIERIHELSGGLSPAILEDLGLSAALRRLVRSYVHSCGIEAAVDIDTVDRLLAKESEIMLYRILQEALSNIEIHAQARHFWVEIHEDDGMLRCIVEDDGRGFDVDRELQGNRGLGLATMNERVRTLGGSLEIRSQPNDGTRVTVKVPLAERIQAET